MAARCDGPPTLAPGEAVFGHLALAAVLIPSCNERDSLQLGRLPPRHPAQPPIFSYPVVNFGGWAGRRGGRRRTVTLNDRWYYLFDDKFGRPGKGNDKGTVEGVIGYGRRNFLVPAPRFDSFDDLNAWLEDRCLRRQDDIVRGHSEPIGERLMRDLDALMVLPAVPYDACEKVSTRATSISMVRYRNNDYTNAH
jgi:hypothetical protein